MTNPAFTLTAPTRIVVEWGAATSGRLAQEAARLGKRPLVVAGRNSPAPETRQAILESLRAAGLTPTLHTGIPPEPDIVALQACMDAATTANADSVIAIGGGSVLDVAKGAAALAGTGHPTQAYFDGNLAVPETVNLPILAAPTTAGTGSEVTWVGVYTDKEAGRKASIRGSAMMPAIALLDAQLTVTCPWSVTLHSGMDAFVQAVEAYTSKGANPLTDALALEAAKLCHPATLIALRTDPQNREAREAMALGSLMAGMALNTSRLGLVHGLAHPVGALTGAAHGLICAMLLLPVVRFNREAAAPKYASLARELFAPDILIEALEAHMRSLPEIPPRLRDIGLRQEDLERVAAESQTSGSTKANPRPASAEDALSVLQGCY